MPHYFNCSGPATAAAPAAAQSQSISTPVAILPDTFPINSGSASSGTTGPVPANALFFACINANGGSGSSFNSVTDSHSDTYNVVQTSDGSNVAIGLFYFATASQLASGTTVTAVTSDASQWGDGEGFYAVGAIGGLDTHTSHNDDTVNGTTSLSLSTGTLAQNVEIVIGCFNTNGAAVTWTESAGFTTLHNDNNNITSYKIVDSTASVTWNPTFTATGPFNAILASFKA